MKNLIPFAFILSMLLISGCSKNKDVTPVTQNTPKVDLTITGISPLSGQPGTIVTIKGTGFSDVIADNAISFHGTPATVTSANDTVIVVTAPPGATGGPISVNVAGVSFDGPTFSFYNVYVYGYHGASPKYWKDGAGTDLLGAASFGAIYDLFISGADVYAVGYLQTNSTVAPTYWKNGVAIPVAGADEYTKFNAITVSGSDVYICGSKQLPFPYYIAKYWKNGVEIPLSDGTTVAKANDIAVVGADVYVVGTDYPGAKLWKNGVGTILPGAAPFQIATKIFVSGTDVYVCGTAESGASVSYIKYWKNGVSSDPVTPSNGNSFAYDMVVLSSDIYFSGVKIDLPGGPSFWKNGVVTSFPVGEDNSYSPGLAVFSGDVYVVVSHDHLYKNGVLVPPFPLQDQFARLYGVIVFSY